MSSPWTNASTSRVASGAGGAGCTREHSAKLSQRATRIVSAFPCYPCGVVPVEVEADSDHAADEPQAGRLSGIDEMGHDVVNVPIGTRRGPLPLFWLQRLEVANQRPTFVVHHRPDDGAESRVHFTTKTKADTSWQFVA